jgi:hypothetical protein
MDCYSQGGDPSRRCHRRKGKAFWLSDDITVVTVERLVAVEESASLRDHELAPA